MRAHSAETIPSLCAQREKSGCAKPLSAAVRIAIQIINKNVKYDAYGRKNRHFHSMPKLLCFCDTPQLHTGFGRVARNLISRWKNAGAFNDGIHVVGIGYQGWPTADPAVAGMTLYPAASAREPVWFNGTDNFQRFLNLAFDRQQGFTHVWMMQDPHLLGPLAEPIANVRAQRAFGPVPGMPLFTGYFPVDGPMAPETVPIFGAVDRAVCYTQYGLDQYQAAKSRISPSPSLLVSPSPSLPAILPHGVDTRRYRPLSPEARRAARARHFAGWLPPDPDPDEFLIINVNAHQRRKGLYQSLEILAHLLKMAPEVKWRMYFHCKTAFPGDGTDLFAQCARLGLTPDHVRFGDNYFADQFQPALPEEGLVEIYNSADLYLTTTHGEGWGLTVAEAMACGIPVAAPFHTGLTEMLDGTRAIELPIGANIILPGDNNTPRPVVDAESAAQILAGIVVSARAELPMLADNARAFISGPRFDWDVIACRWLDEIFQVPLPVAGSLTLAAPLFYNEEQIDNGLPHRLIGP